MPPHRLTETDDGLRVITEPVGGARSLALGAWIGVGSRFEEPGEAGISHFLEHMLFKGTSRLSAAEIAQGFDGIGAEVNAATGRDYTVVYTRFLDQHIDHAFGLVADMVSDPVMAELEPEREVVLEEIAMYEDDPSDQVHDLIGEAVFPGQALGRPVIGTADIVGAFDREGVGAYHRGHYTPRNMVIAAAGSLDHDDIVARSRDLASRLTAAAGETVVEPGEPGAPRAVVKEKETEQVHLTLGGPGLTRGDDRRHAQAVLDNILGGSMSSRLFQEVRERRGLCYSVGTYTSGYSDCGQVGVYVGTRAANIDESLEVIAAELRMIAEEEVPEDELSRARENLKGRLVLGSESTANRMNRLGRSVLGGNEVLTIDEVIARVDAVTAADISALAQEFWRPERLSLAAITTDGDVVEQAFARHMPHLAAA